MIKWLKQLFERRKTVFINSKHGTSIHKVYECEGLHGIGYIKFRCSYTGFRDIIVLLPLSKTSYNDMSWARHKGWK